MALFLGVTFEDMFVGLAWPCSVPPGWAMVWDGPSAGADSDPRE